MNRNVVSMLLLSTLSTEAYHKNKNRNKKSAAYQRVLVDTDKAYRQDLSAANMPNAVSGPSACNSASDTTSTALNSNTASNTDTTPLIPSSPAVLETFSSPNALLEVLTDADFATNIPPSTGPFTLPPLEYSYDALEPYIDEATMRYHHDKHHAAYVNNLNRVLARYPEFYNRTLEELLIFTDELPSDIQTQVINNAGGHYNHSLTWKLIGPNTPDAPVGTLADVINAQFGCYNNLKSALTQAAMSVFGSGYAWLVVSPSGRLQILTTEDQNTPLPLRVVPLLLIDVWEHAYYLKHKNERENYIENFFNVINWERVNDRYESILNNMNTPQTLYDALNDTNTSVYSCGCRSNRAPLRPL